MTGKKKLILAAGLFLIVLIIGGYIYEQNLYDQSTAYILDTDVGTDDAFAFLTARSIRPNPFDFIVASQGNTSLNGAVENAIILKKYLGLNATVVQGLPPEEDENVDVAEKNTFHGNDGLANIRSKIASKLNLTKAETANFIRFEDFPKALEKYRHIVYIVIGPTTNLANLLDNESIKEKITGIYIMGGGISTFNCSHDTEFNFSKDPKSVNKVLNSGLNVTLFPLDLTNHQTVSGDLIEKLKNHRRFSEFITFLEYNRKANREYNGLDAAVLHDTMPILYYLRPHYFKIENMNITVDQYGATRVSEDGAMIHVALEAEKTLLTDTLTDIFTKVLR